MIFIPNFHYNNIVYSYIFGISSFKLHTDSSFNADLQYIYKEVMQMPHFHNTSTPVNIIHVYNALVGVSHCQPCLLLSVLIWQLTLDVNCWHRVISTSESWTCWRGTMCVAAIVSAMCQLGFCIEQVYKHYQNGNNCWWNNSVYEGDKIHIEMRVNVTHFQTNHWCLREKVVCFHRNLMTDAARAI